MIQRMIQQNTKTTWFALVKNENALDSIKDYILSYSITAIH